MATYTSVFGAIEWISERLETAQWPTHAETLEAPAVGVGDSYAGAPAGADVVDVVFRVEDDAQIEWVTISPAESDERYLIDIYIRSMVAGQSRQRCWERLEELTEVVTGVFFHDDHFTPVGWSEDGRHASWYHPVGGIARVAPAAWPADQGWVGECTVTIAVATRI